MKPTQKQKVTTLAFSLILSTLFFIAGCHVETPEMVGPNNAARSGIVTENDMSKWDINVEDNSIGEEP